MSKPKGQIKVELFCAKTGAKQHETKCTNFISKGLEHAYNYVMRNLFTRGKGVGANEITINNPFYQMVLTDNDNPEKPNEDWALEGDTIGYALTTGSYSGNDAKRGSYNTSESFTSAEQVHIVVDFPTSAGNGTFESIYFTPQNSIYQIDHNYFASKIKSEINRIVSFQKYNDLYYVLHSGGEISSSLYVFNGEWELIDTHTLHQSAYDFHIKSGMFYYVVTGTTNQVWRAPITDLSDNTSLNVSAPGNGERFAGIAYLDGEWILSSSSRSSSSSSSSSVFDESWELVDRVNLGVYGLGYERFKLFECMGLIVANSGAVYNPEDGKFKGSGSEYLRGFVDDEYIINIDGYILPKYRISSRVLLDAPVTKTENTTMKITYDFMLPPLY